MIPVKDNVPLLRFPLLAVLLLAGNLALYLLAVLHGGGLWYGPAHAVAVAHGAVAAQLSLGGVFGSLALHGSFPQLLVDLIALALFALNVEDALGHLRFLLLYLLGGLASVGLLLLLAPNSHVPELGATGATGAVLGGYLLLYPRARVVGVALIPFFATIVEVPALLLILLWVLIQVWFGLAGLTGPAHHDWALAFTAHIGALPIGAALARLLARPARIAAKRPPLQPVY
jgi:membrane associated rhomboid family serine protease